MFSVTDMVAKYENYSDEELIRIYQNIHGYSTEAKDALNIVIEKKGGLDRFIKSIESKRLIDDEINRISNETMELGKQGIDASFINTVTTSDILSAEKVKEIVDNKYIQVEAEIKDKTVDPKTIVTSIIGGVIASIIGGILLGVIFIQTTRVPVFIFAGLVFVCYGIIRLTTGKSKHNTAVIIATFIAFCISVVIAQLIESVFG